VALRSLKGRLGSRSPFLAVADCRHITRVTIVTSRSPLGGSSVELRVRSLFFFLFSFSYFSSPSSLPSGLVLIVRSWVGLPDGCEFSSGQ